MARLKRAPIMIGVFSNLAEEFIRFKRSLGFKYESETKCLSRFCRFSQKRGIVKPEISRSLAEEWISPREGEATSTRSHRITCIRQFAIYLNHLGYEAYVIPEIKGLTRDSFVPYIFTREQINAVLQAVDETEPWEVAKNMHLALPVIFRILYGCGLRVSEVVHLKYKDVNLEDGILTIREAKTDKDRLIPLSDSVNQSCIDYAEKIWWEKDNEYFFLAPDRTMISTMTVYQRYRRYLDTAGISHGGKGKGPRLHDIRHTFAVHVLQKWIENEVDLSAMLPILSTYMGHTSVRATAKYLRLTAEVYPDLIKRVESSCAFVIPEVAYEGN